MYLLVTAIVTLGIGGMAALLANRSPRLSSAIGTSGAVLGSALGLVSAVTCLYSGGTAPLELSWEVPFGSFSLGMDALSAFFLLPVFGLSALAAVYGNEYMRAYHGRKSLGPHWFFFNLLIAGMALVVTARNGVLFLIAWEVMSLAPFFLVTFDDDKESVRSAGWTYLVAAHLGSLPLLVLFIMLGQTSGSLDFSSFGAAAQAAPGAAGILFMLAVVGFGTKAGFLPLHVWLPEAHPAAPSHVSAVMSGVVIKMGIYGILRTLTFIGPPPQWWGITLIGIGLASGAVGILFAIAQHDLKRMLAYSSVENIGIITTGLGIGLLGRSLDQPVLAALGFGGAIFHVLNHAMFKGLLFMGAGSVLHSTGTVNINRLGGLHKKMPKTSAYFLIGAAAVCGLPPFNGFASEFLIYLAGITGGTTLPAGGAVTAWCVVVGLAAVGGLAALCFAQAFGAVFLGEPRGSLADKAHEPGPMMLVPMALLAGGCALSGLLAPMILFKMPSALSAASGIAKETVASGLATAFDSLTFIVLVSAALITVASLLALLRRRLLEGRTVGEAGTWDCGYAAPTTRMQYTASSFTQPITALMSQVLRIKTRTTAPSGLFPAGASFETATPGGTREYIYKPVFNGVASALSRFKWLQHGRIHLYVMYIAITLIALLVWKL